MANGGDGKNRHFILEGVTETEAYRYPGGGGDDGSNVPERNRAEHAAALRGQLDAVRANAEAAADAQRDAGMKEGLGLQVEFESFPDVELAFESLARDRSGIELLNIRSSRAAPPLNKGDTVSPFASGTSWPARESTPRTPRHRATCVSSFRSPRAHRPAVRILDLLRTPGVQHDRLSDSQANPHGRLV